MITIMGFKTARNPVKCKFNSQQLATKLSVFWLMCSLLEVHLMDMITTLDTLLNFSKSTKKSCYRWDPPSCFSNAKIFKAPVTESNPLNTASILWQIVMRRILSLSRWSNHLLANPDDGSAGKQAVSNTAKDDAAFHCTTLHNIALPRIFAFICMRRFDFALQVLSMQLPENRLSATLQKMMLHCTAI